MLCGKKIYPYLQWRTEQKYRQWQRSEMPPFLKKNLHFYRQNSDDLFFSLISHLPKFNLFHPLSMCTAHLSTERNFRPPFYRWPWILLLYITYHNFCLFPPPMGECRPPPWSESPSPPLGTPLHNLQFWITSESLICKSAVNWVFWLGFTLHNILHNNRWTTLPVT